MHAAPVNIDLRTNVLESLHRHATSVRFWAKPDHDVCCPREQVAHPSHLGALLNVIGLIDARSVDPHNAFLVGVTKMLQGRSEVRCYLERGPVAIPNVD